MNTEPQYFDEKTLTSIQDEAFNTGVDQCLEIIHRRRIDDWCAPDLTYTILIKSLSELKKP